ncbi:hypothetical protein MRX96_007837 [Rhipicephalus microplus]
MSHHGGDVRHCCIGNRRRVDRATRRSATLWGQKRPGSEAASTTRSFCIDLTGDARAAPSCSLRPHQLTSSHGAERLAVEAYLLQCLQKGIVTGTY